MREFDILIESSSKEDIINYINKICNFYKIKDYTINEDYSIDVNSCVNIRSKNLDYIPINFNVVAGYFNCGHNNLSSLKGSPYECGIFTCSKNKLTSFEYHPTIMSRFNGGFNRIDFNINNGGIKFFMDFNYIRLDIMEKKYLEIQKINKRNYIFKKFIKNV